MAGQNTEYGRISISQRKEKGIGRGKESDERGRMRDGEIGVMKKGSKGSHQ